MVNTISYIHFSTQTNYFIQHPFSFQRHTPNVHSPYSYMISKITLGSQIPVSPSVGQLHCAVIFGLQKCVRYRAIVDSMYGFIFLMLAGVDEASLRLVELVAWEVN